MLLIIGTQDAEPTTPEADQSLMQAFMAYTKEVYDAGVMVHSNALDSFETATSVRVGASGERVVTDGPFAETREYLGGYYVLDLPDLDAAIDWAARCPGARAGRVEVRPIQDFDLS
ncbi:YciI family protein [Kitasatospora nipponensis]